MQKNLQEIFALTILIAFNVLVINVLAFAWFSVERTIHSTHIEDNVSYCDNSVTPTEGGLI
jgi:HAMP domain-containing protein